MADSLKVALAQLNPKVGDVAGNLAKVRAARDEAKKQGADLVLTSELVLCRLFPPEDLVLKPAFQKRCHEAVEALRADTRGRRPGAVRHHAVARGRQAAQRHHLPRQGRDHRQALQGRPAQLRRVRREARVRAGPDAGTAGLQRRAHRRADLRGCVDAPTSSNASPRPAARSCWCPTARPTRSARPTCACSSASSAWSKAACPSSTSTRSAARTSWSSTAARSCWAPTACSRPSSPRSASRWRRSSSAAAAGAGNACPAGSRPSSASIESIYQAMMLGLRDYVNKTGFPSVVIGLSGGVDSALTAAVAADALGPERVHTLMMPSPYTSAESLEDAKACAAGDRRELRRRRHRAGDGGVPRDAAAAVRQRAKRTSPRRTSRAAPAASP